jgi:threonine aldolase
LTALGGLEVETPEPATNMVYFTIAPSAPFDAAELRDRLHKEQVLIHEVGPRRVRLVLHYWVDDAALKSALTAFGKATERLGKAS